MRAHELYDSRRQCTTQFIRHRRYRYGYCGPTRCALSPEQHITLSNKHVFYILNKFAHEATTSGDESAKGSAQEERRMRN